MIIKKTGLLLPETLSASEPSISAAVVAVNSSHSKPNAQNSPIGSQLSYVVSDHLSLSLPLSFLLSLSL